MIFYKAKHNLHIPHQTESTHGRVFKNPQTYTNRFKFPLNVCLPCSYWFLHDNKVNVPLKVNPIPPYPRFRWFLLSYLLLVGFPMTIYSPTTFPLHVFLLFPYSTVIYRTEVHLKQHAEKMTPFHLGIVSVPSLQKFKEVKKYYLR